MKYLLPLLFCSCSFLTPGGEELKGIPVETVAELARELANKIELYDINKDGFITTDEGIALGLAYGNDIYQAILKFNAENPGN